MRLFNLGFLAFWFSASAVADDKAPPAKSPADRLAVIIKEVKEAEEAFRQAYAQAKDPAPDDKALNELHEASNKRQEAGFAEALEIAKADPKSETGFAALEWMLTIPRSYHLPPGKPALELASEHYAANPKIGRIAAWVGYYAPPDRSDSHDAAKALIDAVAKKNPDRTARGQAMMALAWRVNRKFAVAEYQKTNDADSLAAEAEKAFETVVNDYADCPRIMREGQRSLGEEAKQELFELRHLRVGKTAPELEGEDLDGKKLKLSDHRGKVTVVVFWASWCGPCMQMVPHERKLVARLADEPFVMLGVNGDGDREKAISTTKKEEMTWRSFWNGPEDAHGPISRAWNIRGWPTVYVLDHAGVIRAKNLRGEQLDKAVDELLAEMVAGKK